MNLLGSGVDHVVSLASRVRGERVVHAKGRAYDGELTLLDAASDLDIPLTSGLQRIPVLVRFSRGAGLPDLLPDVLGLALRIPNADGAGHPQDLMLSTGGRPWPLRRLLVPRRDYLEATYTSLISYDVGGRDLLVGALPDRGEFLLATAGSTLAPWVPFARLRIQDALPPQEGRRISFSVAHDAGGMRIGGRWRTARLGAYAAARSAES